MKNILLASTILVASAGIAAAEVRVTGDGRMGVYDNGATTNLDGRVRVNFGLSAEGDHGLTFGGTLRIGQTWNAATNAALGPQNGSVFIAANGLRLTYGDIDGAVANRVAIYGGGLGYTGRVGRRATHAGYLEGDAGAGGQASLRVDYDMSGFGISLAAAQGVANDAEIAVSYSASGLSVAAGYEEGGNWSVSAGYAAGAYSVGLLHSRNGAVGNTRLWGSYAMGATTLRAVVARVGGATDFGVGVTYALGGGANFHAAVAREGAAAVTTAQVGVTFSF